MLGSLTKVLACPGLRIGYVVVPDDGGAGLGVPGLMERLARRQPAWSVGPLALAALPELLASADLSEWARRWPRPAENWSPCSVPTGSTPWRRTPTSCWCPGCPACAWPLARQGVVVRDCASFGLPDHVRIAVPDGDRAGPARRRADAVRRRDTGARRSDERRRACVAR